VTPAEVAASLDEPDWIAQWELLKVADDGFEALLTQYRKWHWTPIEGSDKKQAAPPTDAIIALAQLGVMPPRSLTERRPCPFEAQVDAHCWLVSKGRAWRIWKILDGWLILNSFGEEWHIDLKKAKWESYVEAASAALKENGLPAAPTTGSPKEGLDTRSP
jgi:hypothetical protein